MSRFLTALVIVLIVGAATPAQAHMDEAAGGRLAFIAQARAARQEEQRLERLRERRREARAVARRAAAAQAASEASSTPSPTYSGGCLSDEQIASYARGAGFPESVIPTMVYIAAHRNGTGESGGCPGAINSSSGACGLWQIYPAQPGCTDPAANAAMAYAKYKAAGLSPWGG